MKMEYQETVIRVTLSVSFMMFQKVKLYLSRRLMNTPAWTSWLQCLI